MKEEQQIRVRAEFGVERRRIRVERDRTGVRVFLVCFDWFGCSQPVVTSCINRVMRYFPSAGLIKSIFESLNQIRSIYTDLTGRQNRSDRCESVQKFRNF
jgi:hypothetical protein